MQFHTLKKSCSIFFLAAILFAGCKKDNADTAPTNPVTPIVPVTPALLPSIAAFSPGSGLPNSIISITGTNFSADVNQNDVYIGGIKAKVLTVTATKIVVEVPPLAKSGKILLVSNGTNVTTTSDFSVISGIQTDYAFGHFANMTMDANGNIYGLTGSGSNVIYKIPPTGGIGQPYAGTDKLAKSTFEYLSCITTDPSGNVYVAEMKGIFYKITSDGTISVYANGTNANGINMLNNLSDMVFSPSGTLYAITGHSVRKIDSKGVVSLFITDDSGSAVVYYSKITIDPAGTYLYVTDAFRKRVVKFNGTGVLTSLTGVPYAADYYGYTAQFSYATGLAVNAAGNVFVSDYNNGRDFTDTAPYLLHLINQTNDVNTFLRGDYPVTLTNGDLTQASINDARDIAFDKTGNMYINNVSASVISKITFK